MKYIFFFLIGIFAFSSQLFASSFTNLDDLCINSLNGTNIYPTTISSSGIKTHKSIILPHIFKRITTAQNFVKYDDTLYMNANTFTDEYRYLGSYLVKYNCNKPGSNLVRMSGLKRGANGSNLLGFIHDVNKYGIIFSHGDASMDGNISRVYNFRTRRIFVVTPFLQDTESLFARIKTNSFDGKCMILEVYESKIDSFGADTSHSFDQEYCIK